MLSVEAFALLLATEEPALAEYDPPDTPSDVLPVPEEEEAALLTEEVLEDKEEEEDEEVCLTPVWKEADAVFLDELAPNPRILGLCPKFLIVNFTFGFW